MFELRIAKCRIWVALVLIAGTFASAQESSTPTATETPSLSPFASPPRTRGLPLRFVPPPMQGTVSLGVFDSNGKLVRVLQREAKIDSFTVEENSLSTTWDGKNDTGEDLPYGRYRARGYMVGKLKIEDVGKVTSLPDGIPDHISVKLVINPLTSDTRASMELGIGFDGKGTFLKTMDGLPLASLSDARNVTRVAMEKNGDKAAEVWLDDGSTVERLRVSNIDQMIAFDCGFFELK
jgi:hypothetical protein